MPETVPPTSDPGKVEPETLILRSAPRRVVRFKRGLLIGAAAAGSAAILGFTLLALRQPVSIATPTEDPFDSGRNSTADGLAGLPATYGQMRSETPQLGPPLPGDLGRPILERQRQLGLAPEQGRDEQRAAAERERMAQQARHAREAGVFFQVSARVDRTAPATSAPASTSETDRQNADRLNLDPDRDQNNQQRKLDFLNQKSDTSIYNPHALQTPASPFQVMAGTIIAASLITGINSDLPGLVTAQVTENVYDTVTGRTLLIPQGSKLIGSYDSVVAFGQSRALLVWQRIVMPDGSSVPIDNLPAGDAAGYAGLEDEVDYHTWALVRGVALATLLGVGTELTLGNGESDLIRAIRESTQLNADRAGQRIVEKNLNIQPTITIRPGWPLRVIVQKDIVLRPYRG